ncbi:MAG: CDP-diacylglycerol--glycerol-3-phosphate 3-phosphatidyltransferase [Blastococcus sp.]|jgi:CDP-diacylglycerol--glycerol-3-phosphate 3-phosphatidyltransferase|nr:CDP-diacylglycerol--glycerol-3-phosphate 3-phosphatidyltransferase [Blastococcus sp.]
MIHGLPAMAWTLPNVLTCLRLLAVPFLGGVLVSAGDSPGGRLSGLILFSAASVTDLADGWLARRRGQCTDFGALADPIADKALVATALLCLSGLDLIPWWATVIVLAREVAITALRLTVLRHGVIPASRGGKVKTVTQTALIVLALAAPGWTEVLAVVVLATVLWTVVTGIDYGAKAAALRRAAVPPLQARPVVAGFPALDQQGGGAASSRVRS